MSREKERRWRTRLGGEALDAWGTTFHEWGGDVRESVEQAARG